MNDNEKLIAAITEQLQAAPLAVLEFIYFYLIR